MLAKVNGYSLAKTLVGIMVVLCAYQEPALRIRLMERIDFDGGVNR
jgi:hypothetical protein